MARKHMNGKKKIVACILLICTLLTSCGDEVTSVLSAEEIAAVVLEGQSELPELYAVTDNDEEFDAYAVPYIGDISANGVICFPTGGLSAYEAAVFMLDDETEADKAKERLISYKESRAAAFTGYAPELAEIAESGRVIVNGRFAAIFILPDPEAAEQSFLSCFTEDVPDADTDKYLLPPPDDETEESGRTESSADTEKEPETDGTDGADVYDHDAVYEAYKSGDPSTLTGKNRVVYYICSSVLDSLRFDGMTDYDMELAVHDWIIGHAEYDVNFIGDYDNAPEDDSTPYGLLTNGSAICRGYTSTFQLFMDMAGIECISVNGSAHSEAPEPHAWNMVRLDGEWYFVDVTWDDPVALGTEPISVAVAHKYFNVTGEFMRETDHIWDKSETPEAAATKYCWALLNPEQVELWQ